MTLKKHKDPIKFGLFISVMCALYKSLLCFLRRFSDNDKINASVAGFVSAFAILLDAKSRRMMIALIFFARALDALVTMLERRGIIKKYDYFEVLLWNIMITFNQYTVSYEADVMNPTFLKFQHRFSQMTKNDILLCDLWAKSLLIQQGKNN
ncbi:UNKNOWN [Stylonychia lemnae]|uniref:Uncharacterized protein n=1 Tax=Stylonychia lemnae TaxID=5949 RepID=A0A078AAY0_STYLE|nr:UNKNOWN [Stylonychia lemnae]|eukprot:CDW79410.1 UNKNOWN [Stylonychia lemnae]